MPENALNTLTLKQLKRAVTIKARIATLESALAGLFGGASTAEKKGPGRPRREGQLR